MGGCAPGLTFLLASCALALTPAQTAYQEGRRYSAISILALEAAGNQPGLLPICPAVPLQCALERGDLQQVLTKTVGTKNPQLLRVRSAAAKQLAIASYSKLRSLPESPELHRFQAQIDRDQAKYRASSAELRAALKLAPTDRAAQAELAGSLFLEENYQATLPELKLLLKQNPQSGKLNFFVGHSLFETQDLEAAIPYLNRALAFYPSLLPAHVSLGLTLVKLARYPEAIPHLKAALPLDQDGSLYYQLSRAYQATGDGNLAAANLIEYQKRQH